MKNDDPDPARLEPTLDNIQTVAVLPPVEDEVVHNNAVAARAVASHVTPPEAISSNEVARPVPRLEDEAHRKPLE